MQHKDGDANDQRHGTGWGEQPQLGIGRSFRSQAAVLSTVLGVDVSDGSWLLHSWPDATSTDLLLLYTVPLTRALAAACGSTKLALRGDQGEAL